MHRSILGPCTHLHTHTRTRAHMALDWINYRNIYMRSLWTKELFNKHCFFSFLIFDFFRYLIQFNPDLNSCLFNDFSLHRILIVENRFHNFLYSFRFLEISNQFCFLMHLFLVVMFIDIYHVYMYILFSDQKQVYIKNALCKQTNMMRRPKIWTATILNWGFLSWKPVTKWDFMIWKQNWYIERDTP